MPSPCLARPVLRPLLAGLAWLIAGAAVAAGGVAAGGVAAGGVAAGGSMSGPAPAVPAVHASAPSATSSSAPRRLLSASGLAVSASHRHEAQAFWTAFREAVAGGDDASLAAMTRLPLQLHGEMDDDPVRRVRAADLRQVLDDVLDQHVYAAAAGPRPLRDVIRRLEHLPDQAWLTPTSFRVEQLEFQRVRGRWALVRAYLAE